MRNGCEEHVSTLDLLREALGWTRYPPVLKAVMRMFYGRHDGNRAMVYVRLGQHWQAQGKYRLARRVQSKLRRDFGCYIHFNARIGRRLKLPHPIGVVIGKGARIGNGCTIFQHVTLGGARSGDGALQRYPRLGDGVTVFAGASILGPVEIGAGATIAAHAVVLSHVPAGTVAMGIPARVKEAAMPSIIAAQ